MSIIAVLIGLSLIVALIFLLAYVWAHKTGQYDDIETQSVHILFDRNKKSKNTDYE